MIDFLKLPSPCYVLDEELLDRNLATVDRVRRESGAEIIVALKACAMWSIFPELAKHSDGATASSAAEAPCLRSQRPAHTYALGSRTSTSTNFTAAGSYHVQFAVAVPPLRPESPYQRHFLRPADQPAVFARRDGIPRQPCVPACGWASHERTGARRGSPRCRGL